MLSRDYRDVFAGAMLLLGGLWFSWYASGHYALGTLRNMGPGMFPFALGIVLAGLGLLIIIPALKRPGRLPVLRMWSPLFVLAGVAAFALVIHPFGLIPAVLAVTILSSFAEMRIRKTSLLALCCSLCAIAWLTFSVGLGLPIPMFSWPT